MKIVFIRRWLRPDAQLESRLREQLAHLGRLLHIDVAEVTLERSAVASPPFTARFHLAVPGPDIRVEESDHTLEATVRKALQRMLRLMRDRKHRSAARRKVGVETARSWTRLSQPLTAHPA